jgi:BirA family biotin operon repressor/biotin-[acetyl-CoA-carboxylase] ligase
VGDGTAPYPTTTLIACGAALPQAATALNVLLENVDHRLSEWKASGFGTIRHDWLLRARPPGSPLRVLTGARVVVGRFIDLAGDGALVMATADGPVRIVAGEIMSSPST